MVLSDLAGGQAPGDWMYLIDTSVGVNAGDPSDRRTNLNDLFETITKNITAKTLIFEDALAVRSDSAVNTGKIDYNATAQSFQVSENGGAYQNLVKGVGANTRVAFWTAADELSSDGAFLWDETNDRLLINVSVASGVAPIDVLADGTALAQQWRQNAGPLRVQMILDNVPEASWGTSTNHTMHLLTNNLQRLTVEAGGLVGINKAAAITAQLQVVSQDDSTETLILNTAPTPLVNIAEFYNDNSLRFAFTPAANLGIGLSGAGGATGSITLNGLTSGAVTVNVAAAAGTWTLTLPTTDGNANQFLQTDGNGVTTWATAITGAAPPAAAVQFNDGTNGFDGDPDFLWDTATGTLQLGVALSRTGKLQLRSIVSGSVQLTVGTPSSNHVYAFPDALPTVNQVLQAAVVAGDNVTLGWMTPSAGATINPTDTVIPYRFNATTFNDSPLSVASSAVTMTRSAIGATSSDGIILLNATAAAAGAQQYSPRLRFTGQGWKTNATAASQTVDWIVENQPVQGAASPTTNLAISYQVNGGGFTALMTLKSLSALSSLSTNQISLSDNTAITWGGGQNPWIRYNSASDASALIIGVNSIDRAAVEDSGIAITSALWYAWTSSTTSPNTGYDTALVRQSSGVIRTTNASTGIGSVLIGTSTDSLTGNFTVMASNAATNTLVTVARLGVNSTGTAAAGFGATLSWSAESSTTNDTETARDSVFWFSATHASRTSSYSWSLMNNATLTETMRLAVPAVASPFCLSLFDGTAPNVWTAGAYGAKLYLIGTTLPAVGVCAHFGNTAIDTANWQFLRGRGTNASPTAVQNADVMGDLEWWGQTNTATNNVVAGARIRVAAAETWSAGNNGCQMIFYTSPNAGTITDRMYLKETGTLRVGATSGTYNTTTLLQIGNYASWNTDVVAAIYTGANGTKGLEVIGTNGQTANPFRVFLDAGADLLTVSAAGLTTTKWLNWDGEKRVSTQFDKTSDTTLANVTGLSITVVAGRTYSFKAVLYTSSNVAGGVKAAIAGTATATAITYEALTFDGAVLLAQTRATALGTTVGAVTAVTAALIVITGTITVNAGGTLTVQFAQNASNGAASSVLVGSVFIADDVA